MTKNQFISLVQAKYPTVQCNYSGNEGVMYLNRSFLYRIQDKDILTDVHSFVRSLNPPFEVK